MKPLLWSKQWSIGFLASTKYWRRQNIGVDKKLAVTTDKTQAASTEASYCFGSSLTSLVFSWTCWRTRENYACFACGIWQAGSAGLWTGCPIGWNDFNNLLVRKQNWKIVKIQFILIHVWKKRFLVFWAVLCAFGFKVCKKCLYDRKNNFFN
jgi:hypothetical protein